MQPFVLFNSAYRQYILRERLRSSNVHGRLKKLGLSASDSAPDICDIYLFAHGTTLSMKQSSDNIVK